MIHNHPGGLGFILGPVYLFHLSRTKGLADVGLELRLGRNELAAINRRFWANPVSSFPFPASNKEQREFNVDAFYERDAWAQLKESDSKKSACCFKSAS